MPRTWSVRTLADSLGIDKSMVQRVWHASGLKPHLAKTFKVSRDLTHDYKRNGTTTLFAALEMTEGSIIGTCMDRHRHQEWIKFLKLIDHQTPPELDLHLIVDNYSTHKYPKVKSVAQAPFTIPSAFCANFELLAQHGRTLVPQFDRQANSTRGL